MFDEDAIQMRTRCERDASWRIYRDEDANEMRSGESIEILSVESNENEMQSRKRCYLDEIRRDMV